MFRMNLLYLERYFIMKIGFNEATALKCQGQSLLFSHGKQGGCLLRKGRERAFHQVFPAGRLGFKGAERPVRVRAAAVRDKEDVVLA